MAEAAAQASRTVDELPPERPTSVRYGVLLLLALAAVTAYLTRIALSPAATTVQDEFGINNTRMGEILAAFFLGYLWMQVPSGWLGRRFGTRLTLTSLAVLASGCTIWSGLSRTPNALWVSRVGLGVAQAGLVPCCSRSLVEWFPLRARGMTSAVLGSSMSLGAVLASGLTARLLPHLGWRGVFFAYAAVVLCWTAGFFLWFRDLPEEHAAVNAAELRVIRSGEPAAEHGGRSPRDKAREASTADRFAATIRLLGAMATSSSAWLICSQSYFRAFGQAFFLTLFPAFLEKGYHVPKQSAGMLVMAPLAANVVGGLVGGALVDWILRRTGSKRLSRSGTATVTALLCALFTLAAIAAPDPLTMVAILSAGAFCFGMGNSSGWATVMDISGEHTQVLAAVQNMCGNIGAMECAQVVGRLFDHIQERHASWSLVLLLFFGIHLAGGISWLFLNPNRSAVERAASC